jgi:hypothetical protein
MTTLDLPKLRCLLACATDIMTVRIPEVRKTHGVGEQVELAIANMWIATADCLDRAAKLLAETGEHQATVAHLGEQIRKVLDIIEECHSTAEGFRMAVVMAEAERAVKH